MLYHKSGDELCVDFAFGQVGKQGIEWPYILDHYFGVPTLLIAGCFCFLGGISMKKALSLLLSLLLTVTSAALPASAFAQQGEAVTVSYCVVDYGAFSLPATELQVTADLSDKYADIVGYNDSSTEPTILDATIAAHIAMFDSEEEFVAGEYFKCSGPAGTTAAFGEETSFLSFRLNGATDDGNGTWYNMDTVVRDGDCIDFYFYQDTIGWSDLYCQFNTRSLTVYAGQDFSLSVTKQGWGAPEAAAGYSVICDEDELAVTDSNGAATLSFDKSGVYQLTAASSDAEEYIVPPYCTVTVVENPIASSINQRIDGAATFLLSKIDKFDEKKAVDFLTYLKSGCDMSEYAPAFLNAVNANLAKNDGKLISSDTKGEDLALYGAVISALRLLGYDPTLYNGVNLVERFESLDPSQISNPYYYRVAIEAADEDFAVSLCDRFIKDYYVMGQGMNYYGFSCDNTAVLIASVAKYKERYADVIKDARTVIAKHTNDDGAFYSHTYNTTSPDSTAMVLMAYSAIGAMDLASYMYGNLVNGFESSTGVITNYGSDDAYATKDALLGFEAYYDAVKKTGYSHNLTLTSSTAHPCAAGKRYLNCEDCDRAVSYNYPAYAKHSYKSKITTAPTCTKSGVRTYTCTLCSSSYTATVKAAGHSYTSKAVAPTYLAKGYTLHTCTKCGYKYKDNYVSKKVLATPGSVTLTGGKKYFKVSHKKVSAASGYQIKYSSKKDFSTGKTHTYLGADKLTTKHTKLKSNTRYYVRVRAYKKIKSGDKIVRVYSPWSSTKSVVTK